MLYQALHDQQMGQKGIKKVFSPQMKISFYQLKEMVVSLFVVSDDSGVHILFSFLFFPNLLMVNSSPPHITHVFSKNHANTEQQQREISNKSD